MNREGRTNPNTGQDMEHAANTAYPSVELHIEELVLRGFPLCERFAIGEAVQRGLAKLLTERGMPGWRRANGELTHLNCGSFDASPDLEGGKIGLQIAESVYRRLIR